MPGYELIGKEELEQLTKLIENNSYLMRHAGPPDKYSPCKKAENYFSNFIGSEESLLVSSGTSAIRIALQVLNPNPGSYVVTQPFTFIATFEAILDIGCIPVAIPLDEQLGMASEKLEEFLNLNHAKTAAIMPVHMLGESCDIKKICQIGRRYNIPVIEDNCEALGGSFEGKMLGNWGELGTYSFDFGKIITSGEGGLITGNKDMILNAYELHDHGHTKNALNRASELPRIKGLNFRYSELQAAVLLAQVSKFEKILNENKLRYDILANNLMNYKRPMYEECIPSYDTFMIRTDKKTEQILKILEKKNISSKNVPSAMNWHCSYYWKHFDFLNFQEANEKCFEILSNYVAIGIFLTKPLNFYSELAEEIKEVLG